MARNVVAIVTEPLEGSEELAEIRRVAGGAEARLRLVVPAVEANAFRHALGDVDQSTREAERTLAESLRVLGGAGIAAAGTVGDADPVRAIEDALLEEPADEVLIFEHAASQARWFENGLFERAREAIEPPLRMIEVEQEDGDPPHVVAVEDVGPGTVAPPEHEIASAYLPGLPRADFAGMVAGVLGTILVAVLAAAVTASDSADSSAAAAAILIAIFTALVNMAHVVGLTLFEAVHYRGGFERFFRGLALIGTPLAILATLAILLFA